MVGIRYRRVTADDAMRAQEPNVTGLRKRRLFELAFYVEVILFYFLIVYFREKLLNFGRFKTSEVDVEINALQVNQEVSQQLFVPGAGDFVERHVERLDLMLVLNVYKYTLDLGIAQVFHHGQALMAADDGHIVIDDDGLHVAKFLYRVFDFIVFLIARLELLPGVIGRRLQVADGDSLPFHCRFRHVSLLQISYRKTG